MKENITSFLKNNYKNLIIILAVLILFYAPTNYEINKDGSLIDLNDRITVQDAYEVSGSLNLTYVGGIKGTPAMLLVAAILPSWDAYKYSDYLLDDETYQQQLQRYKVSLKEAEQNATYVALKEANKEVEIKSTNLTVISVSKDAITDLEIGDVILGIEKEYVNFFENLDQLLKTRNIGDKIQLEIKRNNEIKTAHATIREENNKKIIGIYINPIIEFDSKIKITFKSEKQEYGSSGGLMNALLIYEKLTKEDITKGRIISGTGSINTDGSVEEISGVKYKLKGAYKNNADIFIAPENNYKEALEIQKKYKMKNIKIIKGINFSQIIEELRK